MYSGETSPPCVLAGIIERGFKDSGGEVALHLSTDFFIFERYYYYNPGLIYSN